MTSGKLSVAQANLKMTLWNAEAFLMAIVTPEDPDLEDYDKPDESVLAGLRQALSESRKNHSTV